LTRLIQMTNKLLRWFSRETNWYWKW